MKILLIEKNCEIKEVSTKNKITIDELYKKCKFRNSKNFDNRNIWSYDDIFISLFAKDSGRASTENKYELPPPVDSKLYFGNMLVIAHTKKDFNLEGSIIDMTKEMWDNFYNKAMGGFESLGEEDEYSEEEVHPKENLTKNGYLKDGFVVDDDEDIDDDDDDEEEEEDYIPDCDEITSESSEVSMTQEELEAAYGGDSDDGEDKEESDDGDDEDEEYEKDSDEDIDSELEEEKYIYK